MKDDGTPLRQPVGLDLLWRWTAPWLAGVLLAGASLLGLFTASRAEDGASYEIGLITAALALLALAWLIKRHFDGASAAAGLPVLVEDAAALVVLIFLLAALAIAGLLLAARSSTDLLQAVGYALFGYALVFIGWNLKHYFDRQERDR